MLAKLRHLHYQFFFIAILTLAILGNKFVLNAFLLLDSNHDLPVNLNLIQKIKEKILQNVANDSNN